MNLKVYVPKHADYINKNIDLILNVCHFFFTHALVVNEYILINLFVSNKTVGSKNANDEVLK